MRVKIDWRRRSPKLPEWLAEMGIFRHTELVQYRGVAQLVARTAGGREVAGSSPVTPTRNYFEQRLAGGVLSVSILRVYGGWYDADPP
jgi:hypothetical protein